jgi:hypothetical protein
MKACTDEEAEAYITGKTILRFLAQHPQELEEEKFLPARIF